MLDSLRGSTTGFAGLELRGGMHRLIHKSVLCGLAVLLMLAPFSVAAEEIETPKFAIFAVDFHSDDPQRAWVAKAFQHYAYAELSLFERLEPVYAQLRDTSEDEGEPSTQPLLCKGREPKCLVRVYRDRGADVILLGTVAGNSLRYWVHETWTGSQVSHGKLDIKRGTDLVRVRQGLLLALNPVLRVGGLLEQKEALMRVGEERAEGEMQVGGGLVLLLILAAAVLLLPYAAVVVLLGPSALGALRWGTTWRWVVLGTVVLFILAGLAFTGSLAQVLELPEVWSRYRSPAAAIVSGLGWGGLTLLFLRVGFAPLHGIERIRVQNLMGLLGAWGVVTVLRVFLTALLVAPVVLLVAAIGRGFELDMRTIFMIVAPLVALFCLFVSFVVVDACCLYLDTCLVNGKASYGHAHHEPLRRYFMGYLNRLGVPVPHRLMKRALFLSGDVPSGVAVYGGALSNPRIVVDARLVNLALGVTLSRGSQALDSQVLDFDSWLAGWAHPGSRAGEVMDRGPVASRPLFVAAEGQARVGQHFSLLGFCLPRTSGDEIPRRFERADVSRPNAHYAAREMSLVDTDHQSDPTHRDFLFGPLLHGLGSVLRWDTVLGTVMMTVAVFVSRRGAVFARLLEKLRSLYHRIMGRYPTTIGDSYPALHHGRDHLVQYLYYRDTGDSSHLTARASQPELFAVSHGLWDRLVGDRQKGVGVTPNRDRILRLSEYTYFPVDERRKPILKIVGAVLAMGLMGYLGIVAVIDAIRYAPTYETRIQQMEAGQVSMNQHPKK